MAVSVSQEEPSNQTELSVLTLPYHPYEHPPRACHRVGSGKMIGSSICLVLAFTRLGQGGIAAYATRPPYGGRFEMGTAKPLSSACTLEVTLASLAFLFILYRRRFIVPSGAERDLVVLGYGHRRRVLVRRWCSHLLVLQLEGWCPRIQ
ncbi:hypothetical protein Krac_9251 [Ktedonobacter racemifer DSM 44963]|uniref:Uncharacterized protein n=1 Tax=Ktedonobacter racemifer DSM 44963 TaxID=485913 RepID=D6TBB6_KTERA|nr:hypothetical protein Krac_9251 [Ktedonobacter racemifer DSM 44963]